MSFYSFFRKFTEKIRGREGFELVLTEFQYVNISFYYIPPSMRAHERDKEWWDILDKVC